ncbi:cysteine peptidase family C39 domain-containing protein [Sphingobacterium sp. E70]|uniref:cysteine peptidase family C39 domain-containing protein n=1 Tax=Sphingobacterium sp. E70 TaxID=2853439 RepID=UPI00211C048F|nr:cysteine peptidase family C39 domain-containing protein [Sphingobacterium sp. E70]ULT26900.1 cysteine peptidase family C39 domain-containing protein [Sphingobacterium sp. E70]
MRFLKEIVKSESAVKIACACILKFYQVKFTSSNLLSLIDGHNDPHSMLAIKDVLDEYSVKSLAILRKNIKYEDIETPFVSVIQKEDWPAASFTVVIAVNGNKISFLDPQTNNLVTAEISYFESIDKDVLLLLDGRKKKMNTIMSKIGSMRKQAIFFKSTLLSWRLFNFNPTFSTSIYFQKYSLDFANFSVDFNNWDTLFYTIDMA